MRDPAEEVLAGGNVSGVVVRVGATVRKPAGPATLAMEAFLSHLQAAGFTGAPRTQGRDERGRQVLEYVPGQLADTMPPLDSDGLYRVAGLIRDLHDKSAGFELPARAGTSSSRLTGVTSSAITTWLRGTWSSGRTAGSSSTGTAQVPGRGCGIWLTP